MWLGHLAQEARGWKIILPAAPLTCILEYMSYEYQLVFQLPEDCPIEDMGYEDEIALALGNTNDDKSKPHFMDGNSLGGGTIEFFIHTNDPLQAFELCKPLLSSTGLLEMVVAAYRRLDGDEFIVIWPIGYSAKFKP